MESLRDLTSWGALEDALNCLPKGADKLYQTYDKAVDRIKNSDAKEILAWITLGKRQLSVGEIQHALAIRLNTQQMDKRYIIDVRLLVSLCAGLLSIDEQKETKHVGNQSAIIRVAHHTIREYLDNKGLFQAKEASIGIKCVTYLSYKDFESGSCLTIDEYLKRLRIYPMFDYAAKNWGHHCRTTSMELEVKKIIMEFLSKDGNLACAVQGVDFTAESLEFSMSPLSRIADIKYDKDTTK